MLDLGVEDTDLVKRGSLVDQIAVLFGVDGTAIWSTRLPRLARS
jgi:hypothetical protein